MQLPRHPWHGFFVVPLGSTMDGVSKMDKWGMIAMICFLVMYQCHQYHTKTRLRFKSLRWKGAPLSQQEKKTPAWIHQTSYLKFSQIHQWLLRPPPAEENSHRKPSPEALKNLLHNQGGWSFRCLKDSQRITAYRGARHPVWLFYLRWKDRSVVIPQTNTVIVIYHHEISLNVYIYIHISNRHVQYCTIIISISKNWYPPNYIDVFFF